MSGFSNAELDAMETVRHIREYILPLTASIELSENNPVDLLRLLQAHNKQLDEQQQ